MSPEVLTCDCDGLVLTADLFSTEGGTEKPLLFCLPGGGAAKEFFNLAPKFSFVQRMNGFGYDVMTLDHPGTASNKLPPEHGFLTPHRAAEYVLLALRQMAGERAVIGIGHSMGGMIITLMQSLGRPFQSIALLGSSAGGLDWGLSEAEKTYIDQEAAFQRDIEQLTLAKFGGEFLKQSFGPSGDSITFGGETPELVKRLQEITCELYSAGGMMSMTRGSFITDVHAIDVPMFFAFGDHDIGIPPQDAPKAYVNAPRTELVILENTGHNSLAFSSISVLCERLDHWVSGLD